MKLCKKKTNEKLTNCKLLLCIWILNKKNKSKFNEQFQIFQHSFERGANPTTDLQEHRFALRLNAPLFVVSSLSLSLSSQRRQTTCGGGALSLSISLSHFTAHQYQTCACSALSSSLAQHHSWSPLSPSSTSLIVIVIVIKLISSARTTTTNAATEMAKQISSMHSHTHTHIHMHTYIHSHIHTPRWHATEILEKQQLILRKCIKNTHHE